MEKSVFNFVYTYRRQLLLAFIVVFAILGSLTGLISQVLLPTFVKIFVGGLGGAVFGVLLFICLLVGWKFAIKKGHFPLLEGQFF